MVFLSKVSILPNEGEERIGERIISELGLPNGRCEVDDFECEILFESEEIDLFIEKLKAARQRGKFQEWVLSYDLCQGQTAGKILQEGIISEEGSTFRYPNGDVRQ
jgi:hypothetical protein